MDHRLNSPAPPSMWLLALLVALLALQLGGEAYFWLRDQ